MRLQRRNNSCCCEKIIRIGKREPDKTLVVKIPGIDELMRS